MSRNINASPAIILVEPQMGENIGAAARAMANFGLSDLRIINPRDGWPNERATAMAAGALDGLVNVNVFETFEDGIADIQFLLATTARLRDMVKPIYTPREAARHISDKIGQQSQCGILFGRERNGLENEEVARAHAILNVPTHPEFASINLAQSVLLMGYELSMSFGSFEVSSKADVEKAIATQAELSNFLDRLESELETSGFFRSEGLKPTMVRNITNMFTRGELTTQEVNTLQGILSALVREPRD